MAKVGLQASLLVRCAETRDLYVNFDPQILTQIRETDCMRRMGLEIPPFATVLKQRKDILKMNYNKLQVRAGCGLVVRVGTDNPINFQMKND